MTQLFAAMFFSAVLLLVIAVMVDMWQKNRDLIVAALPWTNGEIVPASALEDASIEIRMVPRRREGRYWATPSSSSERPSVASTVSPATVR